MRQELSISAPAGYHLIFREHGRLLCDLLVAHAGSSENDPITREYAARIAQSFGQKQKKSPQETGQIRALSTDPIEPLSDRELDVLHLLCKGCSNKEIAANLSISLNTVKKHSSNIYAKLAVNGRTQAIARAYDLQLV